MAELKKDILQELEKKYKKQGSSLVEKIKNMGFEVLGDIAIIEIEIEDNEILKGIARIIKKNLKNIGVVVRKVGDIKGEFRVGEYKLIEMYPRKKIETLPKALRELSWDETVHKEGNARYLININKVYFSSKLGYERERVKNLIDQEVKERDKVAVLFAGVGPFAIHIARNIKKHINIEAVELNPYAIEYFKKNLILNKLHPLTAKSKEQKNNSDKKKGKEHVPKIKMIHQDVKDFLEEKIRNKEKYKAVIMPAPKDAPNYLNRALHIIDKEGICVFYTFATKEEIEDKEKEKQILEIGKKEGRQIEILKARKCGSVGTNTYRYVVDFRVKG